MKIVSRGTGYETRQSLKAITKEVQFMLDIPRPCTVFCFFDNTVWLNNLGQQFYWSVVRAKFKSYCGCTRARPKNDNKNLEQRNLSGFITIAL